MGLCLFLYFTTEKGRFTTSRLNVGIAVPKYKIRKGVSDKYKEENLCSQGIAFSVGKQGGWQMSVISNVSYSSQYVQKEQKLQSSQRENKKQNIPPSVTVQSEGVSYETTIPDSVSAGLTYIRELEEQNSGTKFFVGTVSYGQTYGNSSDTNFVVNPDFLDKLGTDEKVRKQFEEDVQYLHEFSLRFREQQLSQGREIISQGWFCDADGNWGGWSVSRPVNQSSVLQDMADNAEKIRQEKLEERKLMEQELKEHFGDRFKGFSVKWAEEELLTEETEESVEPEESSGGESESISNSIGVNVDKIARKIAAAKTVNQLRVVIAEIESDMQEIKAGIEKGWCDETEMAKLESLMSMAQNRMGEVEDREATPEEESMFIMASLM